jgi:RNA polymerase sigma-70 factor (ECF subfamily)
MIAAGAFLAAGPLGSQFFSVGRKIFVTLRPHCAGISHRSLAVPDQLADSAETQRLLMRISSGERDAFNELFERHRSVLRQSVQLRLDARLRTRVDASDIVQEAQLHAFRRLDDYLDRRPMPFSLWLRKTAYEQLLNHRRAHLATARRSILREQPFPDDSSMMIACPLLSRGSSPSRRIAQREYHRLVSEAVNELGELDREILLMRNVEGLSQREIAQVLDLSHDAVRKRYGRALIKLQQLLVDRGLSEAEL